MEGTGEGFSEVTLFEYNVSTILSPIGTARNQYTCSYCKLFGKKFLLAHSL